MTLQVKRKRKKPKKAIRNLLLPIFMIFSFVSGSAFVLKSNENQSSAQSVARALTDVIREFYIANDIVFELLIYNEATPHINDIIDYMTKELSMEMAIKIRKVPIVEDAKIIWEKSAVILTKSEEDLLSLTEKSLVHIHEKNKLKSLTPERYKFVVYTEEITSLPQLSDVVEEVNEKVRLKFSDMRFFTFFMINDQKIVNLAANELYSENNCGVFVQKSLNSFNKSTQKWETELKNFEHFQDLGGCMINVQAFYDSSFYADIPKHYLEKTDRDDLNRKTLMIKETKHHGLLLELMQTIADKTNFTVQYTTSALYGQRPETFYANNFMPTSDQMFSTITYKRIVFDKEFHSVNLFGERHFYYLITENDLYNNYEKMLFAFDPTTWILILITYGLTFGIIAGLHLCSKWIKKIVFGEGVNIPAYNALGIFFGIGQVKLPKMNFGRFILILYIWFCLIIRTCYQSKMFEFMTSDMRKPAPKTIDDLVKWDYQIVRLDTYEFKDINTMMINGKEMPKTLVVEPMEFHTLYKKSVNGTSNVKFAFLVDNEMHVQANFSFKTSLRIMSDEKITQMTTLVLSHNHFLLGEITHNLEWLVQSGIPKHLINYGQWFLNRPFDVDFDNSPKVLTIEILEFGFVLWLIACFISIFVWLCECRSLWIRRKLRKIIGWINFFRLLYARMQDYHDKW